jgi:DNA replication and repair protein RecF
MEIRKIVLRGFRNLKEEEIEFPARGLLVAEGANATGKTNFLESIAVLFRGKSFRSKIGNCVKWGEDSLLVKGVVDSGEGQELGLAVQYHSPSRKLRIEEDGVPVSAVSFYAKYPIIVFLPADTLMVTKGPGLRRNFVNQVLVSNQRYIFSLVQYQRALRQRNSALRAGGEIKAVGAWSELLAEHAENLWRFREELALSLSDNINKVYSELMGEELKFKIWLNKGVPNGREFGDLLVEFLDRDRAKGYTVFGPHRDDVDIEVGGKQAGDALSQGQIRGLVISLKIVAHRYIKQITNNEPLLLLDDVLSELDETRQRALLDNLPHTQTILTCTNIPETVSLREDAFSLDLGLVAEAEQDDNYPEESEEPLAAHEIEEGAVV